MTKFPYPTPEARRQLLLAVSAAIERELKIQCATDAEGIDFDAVALSALTTLFEWMQANVPRRPQ
jgi:hypothetical protein